MKKTFYTNNVQFKGQYCTLLYKITHFDKTQTNPPSHFVRLMEYLESGNMCLLKCHKFDTGYAPQNRQVLHQENQVNKFCIQLPKIV